MNASVYRCYDERGRLLYVGCTTQDVDRRITQHRAKHRRQGRRNSWTALVARVDVEEFQTLAEARAEEESALWHERPFFNIALTHGSALGYPSDEAVARFTAPATKLSAPGVPTPSAPGADHSDEWANPFGIPRPAVPS